MDKKLTVGEKIKSFRKRSGHSQMDLEIAIGTSTGSISRIEKGQVNPTKETLFSISKALNLHSEEVASLFNIKLDNISKIDYKKQIEAINCVSTEILNVQNLDEVLDLIFKRLVVAINLKVPGIYLYDDSRLALVTKKVEVSGVFQSIAEKGLNRNVFDLSFPISEKRNILVRAFETKHIQISNHLQDCAYPYLTTKITDLLQHIANVKTVLAIPLIFQNQSVGAVSVGTDLEQFDDFTLDLILQFAQYITCAIKNSEKIIKANNVAKL